MNKFLLLFVFFVLLFPSVFAADIAYIVKNSLGVNTGITEQITANGYSYEVIYESDISKTDLSEFKAILIGNQDLNDPLAINAQEYKTIYLNSYNYHRISTSNYQFGWCDYKSMATSPTRAQILNSTHPISEGIISTDTFFAYTLTNPQVQTSFLSGGRPAGTEVVVYRVGGLPSDAIIATIRPGNILKNGRTVKHNQVFFGITDGRYWTTQTKILFKNSLKWLIDGENKAPIIEPIAKISEFENNLVRIEVIATDPEGKELTYSINDSRFTKIDNVFRWTAGYDDGGNYLFEISVSDGEATSKKIVEVEVKEANRAPILNKDIENLTWKEMEEYTLNLSNYFIDPDGNPLVFGFDSSSDDNHIMTLSPTNGIIIFSSEPDWYGSDWIKFFAFDGDLRTVSNKVTLVVLRANKRPDFYGMIENFSWYENTNITDAVNLSEYFKDVDSTLSFSVIGNENIDVKINEGMVTYEPKTDYFGNETIVFNASDEEYSVLSNEILLEVKHTRRTPRISFSNCPKNINEDSQISCLLQASDFEDDDIELSVKESNELNCSIEGKDLLIKPKKDYFGMATCEVNAEDIDGKSEYIFTINVNNINDAPVFTGEIANRSWYENTNITDAVNLSEYFKDVDSTLSFSVIGNENIDVKINGEMVTYEPKTDFVGEEKIKFKATDTEDYVYSNEINLKVNYTRSAPKITITPRINSRIVENGLIYADVVVDDKENDAIELRLGESSRLKCTLEENALRAIPDESYNGQAWCEVIASDIDGETINRFTLDVEAVNDAPVFKNNISNLRWVMNNNLTDAINLNDYFYDNDSTLSYNFIGLKNISVNIMDNKVSFYPDWYFNGSMKVKIIATDGEYNVTSNDFNISIAFVGKPPVFNPLKCSLAVPEDSISTCLLNATDPENDEINFTVTGNQNLKCWVVDKVLNYVSYANYSGIASCQIRARDIDGEANRTLQVIINAVNDPPTVNSFSPNSNSAIRVIPTQGVTFSITGEDIDGDSLSTNWYKNGVLIASEVNQYRFTGESSGSFSIKAIISDGRLSTSKTWNVIVGDISQYTCEEVGGYVSQKSNDLCFGEILNVKDTQKCCSIRYMPRFEDASTCDKIDDNITIKFVLPENGDAYELGDRLRVDVEIVNNGTEEGVFDVFTYLYDLTEDASVTDAREEINIREDSSKTLNTYFDIPEDLDVDNDYVVLVKVKDGSCSQNYVDITINRFEHKLSFGSFEMPEKLFCGDSGEGTIRVDNIGESDEDVELLIEGGGLNFEESNYFLELDRADEGDDRKTQTLNFNVPENIKPGNYTVRARALYSGESITSSKTIDIECAKETSTQTTDINKPILLNKPNNVADEKEKNKRFSINFSWIKKYLIYFILIIVILGIILMIKKIGKLNRESEESYY